MRRPGLALCIFLCYLFAGCNGITDLQPIDEAPVPATAVRAISSRYPAATDMKFRTLIKGRLWKAFFLASNDRFETQVDPVGIAGPVYRWLDNDFSLYRDLTEQLRIRGGAFSDLMVTDGEAPARTIMTYTLGSRKYRMSYTYEAGQHKLELTGPFSVDLYPVELSSLPPKILGFLTDRTYDLTALSAVASVDANGTKSYRLYTPSSVNNYPVIFDESGNITWIAENSNGEPLGNKSNDEVATRPLLETVSGDFLPFSIPTQVAFEADYFGLKSTRYAFEHQVRQLPLLYTSELREVFINSTTGKIHYDWYRASVIKPD